jgi:hypothetical protein
VLTRRRREAYLDRREQLECLVEVCIVVPRMLGTETDPRSVTPPQTIGGAVRPGTVPRQPDHERRVRPEVRRPEVLGRGEGLPDVSLDGFPVQLLHRGAVRWEVHRRRLLHPHNRPVKLRPYGHHPHITRGEAHLNRSQRKSGRSSSLNEGQKDIKPSEPTSNHEVLYACVLHEISYSVLGCPRQG